jgi:isocitrate dehydrogenase
MKKWIEPHVDTSTWEYYDLSCVSRDNTEDQVLHDAVAAGARVGSIFKEPTVTPTEVQKNALGLKKAWGSPNGAMCSSSGMRWAESTAPGGRRSARA